MLPVRELLDMDIYQMHNAFSVCHKWSTVNIEFFNILDLPCTCRYNTDKQYK